uniref:Uncharacterized protein n=1 Tax=Arundo donax TaxID=35708 RepID=A0A0A8ZEA6_ARUDO
MPQINPFTAAEIGDLQLLELGDATDQIDDLHLLNGRLKTAKSKQMQTRTAPETKHQKTKNQAPDGQVLDVLSLQLGDQLLDGPDMASDGRCKLQTDSMKTARAQLENSKTLSNNLLKSRNFDSN